jgi:hypothetical protein
VVGEGRIAILIRTPLPNVYPRVRGLACHAPKGTLQPVPGTAWPAVRVVKCVAPIQEQSTGPADDDERSRDAIALSLLLGLRPGETLL